MLAAISAATNNHAINILPDMSLVAGDTPGAFQPPVAQRDIKAQVIYCVGGVISPLLASIYLHVLDTEFTRRGLGELVRYADDGVALCRSAARARAALDAIREILASLGLELHPGKTKVADLREGREGLDFLGCHFHARMSGRLWEQKRIIRYYLHRWPSARAMKRLREKVRARTGRNRAGADIRDVINYFRTGNAAGKFRQADDYVVWRLRRLMIKKRAATCTRVRLRRGPRSGSTGTACIGSAARSAIRRQRNHVKKITGKPYAGKPHVRIERGMGKRACTGTAPLTTNGGKIAPGPARGRARAGYAHAARNGRARIRRQPGLPGRR